ncbi:MAG: hypothetical protein ACKO7Z_11250 [Cyanobacteriota bacterium]
MNLSGGRALPAARALLPRCLRSWLKQEQRLGRPSARLRQGLLIGLLLLSPLLAVQLKRRTEGINAQIAQSRDETVAMMEAALAVSKRAAKDWGHWDDAYTDQQQRRQRPGRRHDRHVRSAGKPDYAARIRHRMVILQRDLVFTSPGSPAAIAIQPAIHGLAEEVLALRQVPLLGLLARSILDDIPLLLGVAGVATGLRGLLMLERRHQLRRRRLVERQANTRIRCASRQLDQLMKQPLGRGEVSSEPRAILGRLASAPEGGAGSSQLEQVSQRFEQFLNRASNLALFDSLTQLPNRRYFVEQLTAKAGQGP